MPPLSLPRQNLVDPSIAGPSIAGPSIAGPGIAGANIIGPSLPGTWRNALNPLEAAAIEMLLRNGATLETGLAAALAMRGELSGDSFVDIGLYADTIAAEFDPLQEPLRWPALGAWLSALQSCPMVRQNTNETCLPCRCRETDLPCPQAETAPSIATPRVHALVLEGSYVYLHRLWRAEVALTDQITALLTEGARAFENTAQSALDRANTALIQRHFCLLTGGPGTGKTTAAAHLVLSAARTLFSLHARAPIVAMCAPTGKAAARLGEAFASQLAGLLSASDAPELIHSLSAVRSQTVHRLLRFQPAMDQFQAGPRAPLAIDILLVDEASMLSLSLMHALFSALTPGTKVLLLGDANQLSAVESGTPFADLLRVARLDHMPLSGCAVELTQQWRANAGLSAGAQAIRAIDDDGIEAALQALSGYQMTDANANPDLLLRRQVQAGLWDGLFHADSLENAWRQLNSVRVLCVLHAGPAGQIQANRSIELALRQRFGIANAAPYFRGQLLMATSNDYRLGVMNGDVGLCWPDADGKLALYFATASQVSDAERSTGELTAFTPQALANIVPAFAMTVHKAQGSEFDAVTLILPELEAAQLAKIGLHRALLYTAVTRAKSQLVIAASAAVLRAGLSHVAPRNSGLAARLICRVACTARLICRVACTARLICRVACTARLISRHPNTPGSYTAL